MLQKKPADYDQLCKDALKYIIPHYASNAELAKGPKIFSGGQGCYVYDMDGNKYLDTFASLLTTICGHHRPEIKKAIIDQLEQLEFWPNYVDQFTVPLVRLAKKVAEIMPGDLEVSFFVNSGSEANETAMKMARQYHIHNGQKERYKIVARRHSYHATTLGGTSVTGLRWFREYFEPLLPGCVFAPTANCNNCEFGLKNDSCGLMCLRSMEEIVKWEGPDSVSAIIMDPLPGSNIGYPVPPQGYIKGVRELCDKYGILLIFDEVQSGFGKTGKWFVCEHWGVTPDIMTIGKGFTGGYVPLGATVTTEKIANSFRQGPGSEFRSGSTYGGHTIACAATLANIEIIQNDGLVERANVIGGYIRKGMEAMAKKYSIVKYISGMGTLLAMQLCQDSATGKMFPPSKQVGSFIRQYCWDNGMILRNNGDILVIAPALIISEQEVDIMLGTIDKALELAQKKFLN